MRIQRLQAEGLFSFGVDDDRGVLDLDDLLTAIVGPNASG
jgi:chromosome segregation ATPase